MGGSDEDDDSGPVEFDMSDWDDDSLATVAWMLTGRQIPQEWPRHGILVVPAARADEAEGFIDYVSSNPEFGIDVPEDQWRGAAAIATDSAIQLSVDDFYDGDPARRDSSEVELGSDWTDAGAVQCEVCWVEDTGELYIVRSPPGEPMQVEVVAVVPDRAEVDRLLDGWEQAMWEPNSVEWVRERARHRPPAAGAPHAPDAPEAADTPDVSDDLAALDASLDDDEPWWEPPAEIGWITPDLYELLAAYARGRAQMDPDNALGHALRALDPGTRQRLEEFFDGQMDVVYGDGEGERIRKQCRDALEREYQA